MPDDPSRRLAGTRSKRLLVASLPIIVWAGLAIVAGYLRFQGILACGGGEVSEYCISGDTVALDLAFLLLGTIFATAFSISLWRFLRPTPKSGCK
jgi:hypothetical protein